MGRDRKSKHKFSRRELIPQWLEKRDHGGVVLREPNREEIDPDIQEQRIVEFYSR